MRQFSRALLIVVMVTLCVRLPVLAQGGGFPRTLTDGAGNHVTISAKPQHIVSATLGTDEILMSLVDHSRLVAVTANALDPEESNIVSQARAIPHQIAQVDPEAIIAMQPDIVFVASYTDAGAVKQLRDAKLTVFLLGNFSSIQDIETNITLLGQAVGEEDRAAQVVADMELKMQTVASAVKNVKPLTVMYYGPDGYTDGKGSTIDDVITRAGGVNAVTAGGVENRFTSERGQQLVEHEPIRVLLRGCAETPRGLLSHYT